jgi:hypothetical protein
MPGELLQSNRVNQRGSNGRLAIGDWRFKTDDVRLLDFTTFREIWLDRF